MFDLCAVSEINGKRRIGDVEKRGSQRFSVGSLTFGSDRDRLDLILGENLEPSIDKRVRRSQSRMESRTDASRSPTIMRNLHLDAGSEKNSKRDNGDTPPDHSKTDFPK